MEIRTDRSGYIQEARIVPPPDRARRSKQKIPQKIGRTSMSQRRFFTVLRALGKISAFLIIISLLCSIYLFAFTSPKFNLHTLTCYGCRKADVKQLEKIIRREFPANVLRIDLEKLKLRLEKETWVRQVEIRRVLPSDLILYIQERIPSVILEMRGELMVADGDATVLDKYDSRYGKLDMPVFKGILGEDLQSYREHQEENAARIRQALIMLAEIESGCPTYLRNISEVDLSDRSNLKVLLVDETAEIYLGEKDYRKRFCTLMNNFNQYQELKSQYGDIPLIDMRFDGQIVYRLGQPDAELSQKAGH